MHDYFNLLSFRKTVEIISIPWVARINREGNMNGGMMLSDTFEGKLQRLELLAMNDQMLAMFDAEYEAMLEMLRDDFKAASTLHDLEMVLQRGNQLQALLKQQVTWARQTYHAQYETALMEHHQTRQVQ
jgi:hypothetical protein